jgi:hypothetical protein
MEIWIMQDGWISHIRTQSEVLKGEVVWIEVLRSVRCSVKSFGFMKDHIYWIDGSLLRRSNLALFETDTYTLPDYMCDIKELNIWKKNILCISPSSGALIRIDPEEKFPVVKFEPKHVAVEIVVPKPYLFFGKYVSIQNSIEKWE